MENGKANKYKVLVFTMSAEVQKLQVRHLGAEGWPQQQRCWNKAKEESHQRPPN
jgi:hypothetical protein